DLDRRHASTTAREATSTASHSHVHDHDPEESCDKEIDPASVATTADEHAKPVGALVVPPSCGRNDAQ
ncbi:unnamed protein product, partial [Amoebophrya sp. A25]